MSVRRRLEKEEEVEEEKVLQTQGRKKTTCQTEVHICKEFKGSLGVKSRKTASLVTTGWRYIRTPGPTVNIWNIWK